jgi:CheY-like chemotaxis protein
MSQFLRRSRVLAADNDSLIVQLIADALEDGGFEVETVLSGADAIARLEASGDFAALVTDVDFDRPPSGWELARRARGLNPGIPVVYCSGGHLDQWSAQGVPNSRILYKPFLPSQLVTALVSLMSEASAAMAQSGEAGQSRADPRP